MALPDPDWALVIWCGRNAVLNYNGAFVISRNRNLNELTPEVENELRVAAEKFGIDFDGMCVTDNTNCKE